jgi:hypothetical protein
MKENPMITVRFTQTFALCFSLLVVIGIAVRGEPRQATYEAFLRALAQRESGGDPNAWNAKESAAGLYQIRPCYIADVNRILGREQFTLADRCDPKKAALMVVIYLDYYATPKRLGHEPTWADRARIHNGGPCGFKKACTVGYGRDVMRRLYENNI